MNEEPHIITTEELFPNIENPNHIIVDARSIAAYNGWSLMNEPRGGHIKGAKSLPHKWTTYIDWFEIVKSKGITPDKSIVIYGYHVGETKEVATMLQRAGYENIKLYHDFVEEWSGNEGMPMDQLPNYRQLVYPEWVNDLVSGERPETFTGDNYVICHCHYGNRPDYEKGHIPGAVSLDTLLLESEETWNRRSPNELRNTLRLLGISHDTTVVLYGRFSYPDNKDEFPGKSAGHLAAMRCALIMLYAGVEDVRILNGGMTAWEEAEMEISTENTEVYPLEDFGIDIPGHPQYIVDIDKAKDLLASDNGDLVSVRSWEEFIGNVSGYNYIEKTGRIPGAVFGNCGSDAYHMENYRNLDHTMLEYHEVEKNWQEQGIDPNKHIAFYCGTGWRGSEAFFNAYMLGWKNISVFDGGWFEWSNDPNNPIEKGIPETAKSEA
jgi:thiosulfate/3-mercaptopyruvate sulfurtransferase